MKRMRICSFLLCFMFLLSWGIPVLAAQGVSCLIEEQYDNYPTGQVMNNLNKTGGAVGVITLSGGRNKVLRMISDYASGEILYSAPGSMAGVTKFVLHGEILLENRNNRFELFGIKDASGRVNNLLTAQNGKWLLSDNKQIGSFHENQWYSVDIAVNLTMKTFSLFIDGQAYAKDWKMNPALAAVTSVSFSSIYDGQGAAIELDNFRLYEGNTVYKEDAFEKVAYNSSISKDEMPEREEEDENRIVFQSDFESSAPTQGIVLNGKGNKIAVEYDKIDDNHYLRMEHSQRDCHIDINFSKAPQKVVVCADVRSDLLGISTSFFSIRDGNSNNANFGSIDRSGSVLVDGETVASVRKGKWTNVAYALDTNKKTFDTYVDGKLVKSNTDLNTAAFGGLTFVRIQISNSMLEMNLDIDNIQIYGGDRPRDLSNEESTSVSNTLVNMDDSALVNRLNGTFVLYDQNQTIAKNGEKKKLDTVGYVKNGRTYLPVRELSESFDMEVDWDPLKREVSLGSDTILPIDSKEVKIKGQIITTDAPAEVVDGISYAPLRLIAENILGKKVFWKEGLTIIGDSQSYSDERVLEILNYIIYDRPAQQWLEEQIKNSPLAGQHPRVLLTKADFDRIRTNVKEDERVADWMANVLDKCKSILEADTLIYEKADGKRLLPVSREMLSRILNLGIAYHVTGDKKYSARAWKDLEATAEFNDWNTAHYLDTAEMTMAFAIGYDWFYDVFTHQQRQTIKDAMMGKGLIPAQNSYNGLMGGHGTWVAVSHNNWNTVCNAGTICAALALGEEDSALGAFLLANGLRSIERSLAHFAPNGAWYEGLGYWNYTVQYYKYLVSTLQNYFGSDFGLLNAPGINNTAYYAIGLDGPGGANNYHDFGGGHINSSGLFWLSDVFDDANVTAMRLNNMDFYNLAGDVEDIMWYRPELNVKDISAPKDMYFGGDDAVASRADWSNNDGIFVSYHAGDNGVSHGHYDAGTYVLDALGERWAYDLGSDNYDLPNYYTSDIYYKRRPEAHNLAVINPGIDGGQDKKAITHIETFVSKERGSFSIMDLSNAYHEYAKSARRGIMLGDDRQSVTVRDEFELNKKSDIYWFMQIDGKDQVKIEDNVITLTKPARTGNKVMKMEFLVSGTDLELSVGVSQPLPTSPNPAGQKSTSMYNRIIAKYKDSGQTAITVKFIPQTGYSDRIPGVEDIALDSWDIPEGALASQPRAAEIFANGESIQRFNPGVFSYIERIPFGTEQIPTITATGMGEVLVEVVQAQDWEQEARVIVQNADNPDLFSEYTIQFEFGPSLGLPEGGQEQTPTEVRASDEPQPENNKENAIDGRLSTRWSASGEQWIELVLDEVHPIHAVSFATYLGSERSTIFSLQTSLDGISYKTVCSGTTTGVTDGFETIVLNGESAKYVRLLCNGTTNGGAWNSITEFKVFTN